MSQRMLPFPRGQTYWNGDSALISASRNTHLEGARFMWHDDLTGSPATSTSAVSRTATREPIVLRVLRNKSGGNLRSRRAVGFGATADWYAKKTTGYTSGRGKFGYAVDDAYTTGTNIASNDLFYVVEDGPVCLRAGSASTNSVAITQGACVMFTTNGVVRPVATSVAMWNAGVATQAISASLTGGVAVRTFRVGPNYNGFNQA